MGEYKQTGSVSVAWYKLADLIARGEREKALNVYKLLAYSLPDKAYALQLEGDILWFLRDHRAYEKYYQAALIYKEEQRWAHMVALGEHLRQYDKKNNDILVMLVNGYAFLGVIDRCIEKLKDLVQLHQKYPVEQKNVTLLCSQLTEITQGWPSDRRNEVEDLLKQL